MSATQAQIDEALQKFGDVLAGELPENEYEEWLESQPDSEEIANEVLKTFENPQPKKNTSNTDT